MGEIVKNNQKTWGPDYHDISDNLDTYSCSYSCWRKCLYKCLKNVNILYVYSMRLEEHFCCFAEGGDNVLKLVIYGHAPPHNLVSSKKSLSLTGHWHILESHVDSSYMTGFGKSRLTER